MLESYPLGKWHDLGKARQISQHMTLVKRPRYSLASAAALTSRSSVSEAALIEARMLSNLLFVGVSPAFAHRTTMRHL